MIRNLICSMGWLVALGSIASGQSASELPKDQAKLVLDRYCLLLSRAKTLHVVEEVNVPEGAYRSEHWLIRFGPYRSVSTGRDGAGKLEEHRTYATTKVTYMVHLTKKTYDIMERFPGSPFLNGLEPFCQKQRPKFTVNGKVTETKFQGKPVYAIETGEQSLPGSMCSVFVDRKTLTPVGWQYALKGRAEQTAYTFFKLDEKMDPKSFIWKVPKGFKLRKDMRVPK